MDDNGGSLTVDATALDIRALTNADVVTAELSAVDNAVLDTIATPVATISATPLQRVAIFDASDTQVTSFGGASPAVVDTNNSTTANLGNGGAFTGTATDVLAYSAVCVNLYSDQDGSADGMQFQFCSNNSFGADTDSIDFNMTGGETRRFQFPVTAQYFRLVYTNGTTPTTDLDIQTILHPVSPAYTSIHKVEDNVSVDRSAELVKAALIAQVNGSGDFIPIQANAGGVLKVGGSVEVDTWSAGTLTVAEGGSFGVQEDGLALTALEKIDNASIAHSDAITGSHWVNLTGLEARSSEPAAVSNGDATRAIATLLGKAVTVPYAVPGDTWSYAGVSGGITDTADDVAKAAAGASIRNYITKVSVVNGHATVGTEVVIKDGSTVIWRSHAEPAGGGVVEKFEPPLRGTTNTAVNVTNITTGSKTYFNLQGFIAAE